RFSGRSSASPTTSSGISLQPPSPRPTIPRCVDPAHQLCPINATWGDQRLSVRLRGAVAEGAGGEAAVDVGEAILVGQLARGDGTTGEARDVGVGRERDHRPTGEAGRLRGAEIEALGEQPGGGTDVDAL